MAAKEVQNLRDTLKLSNPSLPPSLALSSHTTQKMSQTSDGIQTIITNLRNDLKKLREEIVRDKAARAEYDVVIGQLEVRKSDLETRVKTNTEWAKQYDLKIGPFEATYDSMTGEIGKTYEKAKEGHQRGLEVLKKEFGYTPAFKQGEGAFSAVAFRPK